MSSSSAVLPKQFWVNSQGFRDASDYTLFKKRQSITQLVGENVRPPLLQSLQNRTSYQFGLLDCRTNCPGGFPRSARLS